MQQLGCFKEKGTKRLRKSQGPRVEGCPSCNAPDLLLFYPPEQITAHSTKIYLLDTQTIRILTPARWPQFDLTEQVLFFHILDNQ